MTTTALPPTVSPTQLLACSSSDGTLSSLPQQTDIFMQTVHYGNNLRHGIERTYSAPTTASADGEVSSDGSGYTAKITQGEGADQTSQEAHGGGIHAVTAAGVPESVPREHATTTHHGKPEQESEYAGDDEDDRSVQFDLDFVLDATNSLMEMEEQERIQQEQEHQQRLLQTNLNTEGSSGAEDGLRDGDLAFVSSSSGTSSSGSLEQYSSDEHSPDVANSIASSSTSNSIRPYHQPVVQHHSPASQLTFELVPCPLQPYPVTKTMHEDMIDIQESSQQYFQKMYAERAAIQQEQAATKAATARPTALRNGRRKPLCLFVNFMGTRMATRPASVPIPSLSQHPSLSSYALEPRAHQPPSSAHYQPNAKRRKTF